MSDPLRPPQVDQLPAHVGRPAEYPGGETREQVRTRQRDGARRASKLVPLFVGAIVLVSVAIPAYFLIPLVRDLFRQDALRSSGIEAPGEILRVQETNSRHNNLPVIKLALRVAPHGGEVYETEVSQGFSMLHAPNLRPGAGVLVRYDPDDPQFVVVTQTGTAPLSHAKTAREPQDPSACAAAARCCKVVVDSGDASSCANFESAHIPPSACQTALEGFNRAAASLGRSCDEN